MLQARYRWALIIGALLLLVASSIISTVFFDSSKEGSLGQRLASQHAVLGVQQGDILLIGDDLIAEGLWHELLPRARLKNRGLNGQTTGDLLLRIIPALDAKPGTVLLNIGANDLQQEISQQQILANFRELINLVSSFSPDSQLLLSSVLPYSEEQAAASRALNQELTALAAQHQLAFLNLENTLLDEQGQFLPGMADHRMRLHGQAYLAWRDLLSQHLDEGSLLKAEGSL